MSQIDDVEDKVENNVQTFQQSIEAHDPSAAPRIDLRSVLIRLHQDNGSATRSELMAQSGLDPNTFAATVTAMTSMGLVTVSSASATASVVMTPLGEKTIKALS